jgi:hypothetical protein
MEERLTEQWIETRSNATTEVTLTNSIQQLKAFNGGKTPVDRIEYQRNHG